MERFELVSERRLAERVKEYVVYAPEVARHCRAGQFIILRVDEEGERVPFTVCDYSREEGTVCILVQEVGYTTAMLARLKKGDRLADFVGPLGNPTDLGGYSRILLVGGGIGSAGSAHISRRVCKVCEKSLRDNRRRLERQKRFCHGRRKRAFRERRAL